MTLHDCMEYAISHSTKMRIEAANRNDEQWQRRQSIMQLFTPNVDAQTYAYNQYSRNLDPETNTYNSVTTFHNGYSVSAGITLFDGFKSINNMRLASTMVKLGRSKEQQTEDQICLATMEAYYNVVYYTELEKVLTEQVETAKSARDKAVRQEELGQKGHADVLQMESELAQKEYQLIDATNKRRVAMITLKDVIFWPSDRELVIEDHVQEPLVSLISSSDLAETAKSVLPSAEIATLNVKQVGLDLNMAQGSYSPKLSLYGGGYTPDMINYAHSTDVYKIWADMVAFDYRTTPDPHDDYFCVFAGRRDGVEYHLNHEQMMEKYAYALKQWDRLPEALSGAMGKVNSEEGDGRSDKDFANYDMDIDNAAALNATIETLPDVYYFSYPASSTVKQANGTYAPDNKKTEVLFRMSARAMGVYTGTTKGGIVIDESWLENDGLVNTISAMAPSSAPSQKFNAKNITPGTWNIMPTFDGDHMSLSGGLFHHKNIKPFFTDLISMINSL